MTKLEVYECKMNLLLLFLMGYIHNVIWDEKITNNFFFYNEKTSCMLYMCIF